jgi:hypothetical protein
MLEQEVELAERIGYDRSMCFIHLDGGIKIKWEHYTLTFKLFSKSDGIKLWNCSIRYKAKGSQLLLNSSKNGSILKFL